MNNGQNTPKKAMSKKRLQWTILILLGILLVLLLISWGIDAILASSNPDETDNFPHIDFYPADYSENIFEDAEYMELVGNGVVLLYEESGLTQALVEGKTDQFGAEVRFFADYLSYMIHGDVSAYNQCYSKLYYETNAPKDRFTMQKIYDVKLSYYSEAVDENTGATNVTYKLEYSILNNNGTLRNDSLNGNKPQYITISNREGTWLIDRVGTVHYQ